MMKRASITGNLLLALLAALHCYGCALDLSGRYRPFAEEDAGDMDSISDEAGETGIDVDAEDPIDVNGDDGGGIEAMVDASDGTMEDIGDGENLDAEPGEDGLDAVEPEADLHEDILEEIDADASDETGIDIEADEGCDPSSCPGWCCDPLTGACCLYTDCNELHLAHPEAPTGTYEVDPDGGGPGAAIEVYCDMDIDGGGWTLAGRTTASPSSMGSFGWKNSRGSVHDDSEPYSLNVEASGISFTEILLGERSGGKTWGSDAYKTSVPSDFLSDYSDSSYRTGGITTVIGSCSDPWILRYFGYTDRTERFFFRDMSGFFDGVGLLPDGFYTWDNNCWKGGNLNGDQGMIFIR